MFKKKKEEANGSPDIRNKQVKLFSWHLCVCLLLGSREIKDGCCLRSLLDVTECLVLIFLLER